MKNKFKFLNKTKTKKVINLLEGEHPQTIALVVLNLKAKKSAKVLDSFPEKLSSEIIVRISRINNIDKKIIIMVSRILKEKLKNLSKKKVNNNSKKVSKILAQSSKDISMKIINNISKVDELLALNIKNSLFTFDRVILSLDKYGMSEVMKAIEKSDLIVVFKDMNTNIKNKFLNAMSSRAKDVFEDEVYFLGAVKKSEINDSRENILFAIETLEEEGCISLNIFK